MGKLGMASRVPLGGLLLLLLLIILIFSPVAAIETNGAQFPIAGHEQSPLPPGEGQGEGILSFCLLRVRGPNQTGPKCLSARSPSGIVPSRRTRTFPLAS